MPCQKEVLGDFLRAVWKFSMKLVWKLSEVHQWHVIDFLCNVVEQFFSRVIRNKLSIVTTAPQALKCIHIVIVINIIWSPS